MPKKKKKTKSEEILEVLVHETRHLTHRSESSLPLSLPPGFFFILSLSLSLRSSMIIPGVSSLNLCNSALIQFSNEDLTYAFQ
jgi:hypothetical protein